MLQLKADYRNTKLIVKLTRVISVPGVFLFYKIKLARVLFCNRFVNVDLTNFNLVKVVLTMTKGNNFMNMDIHVSLSLLLAMTRMKQHGL